MKRLILTTLATFLCFGICSISFAQQSDNAYITSSAEVLSQLVVTAGNNLSFGAVSPGIAKTVNYYDDEAGTFTVSAGEGATVNLEFTQLPDELNGQSTSATLDINFGSEDAAYETSASTSSGSNNKFDPNSGDTINDFPSSAITIFIGGTVNPTNNQAAETYEGNIILTATYN